ncbi:NAD(P)-binding protein [Peniophora sp. CONT]|nr:NAD(P)-binding protein [Peniophora sp. CONT]
MASDKTTIFFTGATGYVGGAILTRLLEAGSFEITALVRNADKAKKLNALGVSTIIASLDDSVPLVAAAASADVVMQTAHADHLPAIKDILKGMRQRFEKTGKQGILIHTSGTGVLIDDAKGMHDDHITYDDSSVESIESLPADAFHREVDIEVVKADQEGYIRSHIIIPSTIWGVLTGRLADEGISHTLSHQIPWAIAAGLKRGQGGMVGKGLNVWPHVELHELAEMYMIILRAAIAGTAPHGREGHYFGASGQYRLLDAAKAYTAVLYKLGKSKTPEPTTYTKEEIDRYFGGSEYLGSNSKCKAVRARELGWKPTKTTEDFYAFIPTEVETIAKDPSKSHVY